MRKIEELAYDERIAGSIQWDTLFEQWRCFTRETRDVVWCDELLPALKSMYPLMKEETDVVLLKHQNGNFQIIEDHADLMATVLRFS